MTPALVDFAVVTIFAREFLEGSIIVGQYRTMVLLGGENALHPPGTRVKDALRAITLASLLAAMLALLVLACVAIPLAVLSKDFDPTTGEYIEASSKLVASFSLLILSLKIPRFLGIYGKRRRRRRSPWKVPHCPPATATSSHQVPSQRSFDSPETQPAEEEDEELGDSSDDDENDDARGEARSSAAAAQNELNHAEEDEAAAAAASASASTAAEAAPNPVSARWGRPCWPLVRSTGKATGGRRGSRGTSSGVAHPDTISIGEASNTASHLTLREIKFNVAWNLWREVAECGAFLLPFFLTGSGTTAIPLSAVIGGILGMGIGYAVYAVNRRYQRNRVAVCVFATLLMVFFSAGLFTDACHIFEAELGTTRQVWHLQGAFWNAHALPMTLLKPFGYDDSRTVLEIAAYWLWLALAGLLHYHWYRTSPRLQPSSTTPTATEGGLHGGVAVIGGDDNDVPPRVEPSLSLESTASPSLAGDAVDDDDDDLDSGTGSLKKELASRASCATTDIETFATSVHPLDVEIGSLEARDSTQSPLSIDV